MLFLTELLTNYQGSLFLSGNAEKLPVTTITADSRQVTGGAVFVAIRGNNIDGSVYIAQAVEKGAVAIVTDNEGPIEVPPTVALVRVDNARLALAKMAEALYAPQPTHIAAVTGTDGKTSTADFLRQLWEMSELKAASIGTLGVIGPQTGIVFPAVNTTPDPVQLHQTLHALASKGCQHVAMEASSHGLHQYRLDGVHLRAAAFTNLTRDHLDYHKTPEAYFQAKSRLFSELLPASGTAVLNADDTQFKALEEICNKQGIKIISYGQNGKDYTIKKITHRIDGLAVQASIEGKSQHFMLNMVGEFQVMNALAALGLFVSCGGALEDGLKHLPHLHNVKGRLERVATHPSGAPIFIDYAHTPAALANVLKTVRKHVEGKLVVVFGCGGDRDKGKRPEMGKAATELADIVIVTDDNPRSEDPDAIRAEIMKEAPNAKNIGDRAEAIATAIKSLNSGDFLLIAGKGHENTQIIGSKVTPFNDAEVARYAVKLCEQRFG
ncbi:MAG TPA: UDP-N-acetylmuramoyl-L-alanyl-D-glutamate--2,6-diaminopimelate ligase [Rickettsiales bacterium]|nr:UDP-N-acetylmuramoyl-L-alanyl-D-glutamate--2,6-diaminopimelate ligase [Rickettsiales bacterium]